MSIISLCRAALLVTICCTSVMTASNRNHQRPNKCADLDFMGNPLNPKLEECVQNDVCSSRRFNISYIEFPPYYYRNFSKAFPAPIENMLLRCCGECVRTNIDIINVFRNISELNSTLLQQSDFIFPFFGNPSITMLNGFYYLPLRDIPPAYLITERKGADFVAFTRKILPITVICVLVSVLAGFICWLSETWSNREEFSRTLLIGWFEGFWWSFVTMTTVGFGDKTPRSLIGRLFAVVWISIGVITYGLLTGIVFSEVEKMNNPPPPDTDGKLIGALMYRDFDARVVARIGGKIFQHVDFEKRFLNLANVERVEPVDFYEDVFRLSDKLRKKEIDAFVLDRTTLWFLKNVALAIIKDKWTTELFSMEDHVINAKYFLYNTMATQVSSNEEVGKLTYGILVKNRDDYDYLVDYATDGRFRRQTREWTMWNLHKEDFFGVDEEGFHTSSTGWKLYSDKTALLFSIEDDFNYFLKTVYIILISITVLFVIGIVFELRRTNFRLKEMFVKEELTVDQHQTLDRNS